MMKDWLHSEIFSVEGTDVLISDENQMLELAHEDEISKCMKMLM